MSEFPKPVNTSPEVSEEQARDAVRTLIAYLGDDPDRPGVRDTPARVLGAYREFFAGYRMEPAEILAKTFDEVEDYRELVVVRNIDVESHCEHHMLPIRGHAHIAYLPAGRVVGLSKLARLVDAFARRLQIQERMTIQIAEALQRELAPRGVAVCIEADHACMSRRGIRSPKSLTVTQAFTGELERNDALKRQFLEIVARDR